MEDLQAIHRLKRGDIGGLEGLVARYQSTAVQTAFLVTQDLALAEDVVQDVFVNLFRRIRRFDVNRQFKPYLMKSVVNAALDAVEKEAKWVHSVMDDDTCNLEELIVKATSVEDQVEFAQLRGEIDTAIAALPAR
jgi:RNA polymerase sigma-70 factor (ECF subfamily)